MAKGKKAGGRSGVRGAGGGSAGRASGGAAKSKAGEANLRRQSANDTANKAAAGATRKAAAAKKKKAAKPLGAADQQRVRSARGAAKPTKKDKEFRLASGVRKAVASAKRRNAKRKG